MPAKGAWKIDATVDHCTHGATPGRSQAREPSLHRAEHAKEPITAAGRSSHAIKDQSRQSAESLSDSCRADEAGEGVPRDEELHGLTLAAKQDAAPPARRLD